MQDPPAAAIAGMLVVARMALDELRSHRRDLPEHLAPIIDDALRVIDPIRLPDAAYVTASRLLQRP
jgi:hypothetical protein